MKKIALIAFLLTGCATTGQAPQAAYVQSCAAYGAAFETALQLRQAGKLNQAQIDQITMVDQQITPICTGTLPTDPTSAIQQITAAVTTLTILEAVQQGSK